MNLPPGTAVGQARLLDLLMHRPPYHRELGSAKVGWDSIRTVFSPLFIESIVS
jgi:hypothetical protein